MAFSPIHFLSSILLIPISSSSLANSSRRHKSSPISSFLPILFCLLLFGTTFGQAFILQELPLYRSTRDSDSMAFPSGHQIPLVPFHGPAGPVLFARPARAFNFQRLNRLRDYWHRNEALRRLTESSRWNGGKRALEEGGNGDQNDGGQFWRK